MNSNVPIRPRRKVLQQMNNLVHQIVPLKDRSRVALTATVGPILAEAGRTLVNVVKCAEHAVRKRQYLNYRSNVEQQMTTARAGKYAHGGEGNEHKQYMPLILKCNLGSGGNPFALPFTPVECCQDELCEVCNLLTLGLCLTSQGRASHYTTANAAAAALWCRPESQHGLMAVAVCRVVVGTPEVVSDSSDVRYPGEGIHACIVSDGNPSHDGTYLFRDDAIDVQNIVLFV